MKIFVAIILLVGTASTFPLGENDESKSTSSISILNSLSLAKSEESEENPQRPDEAPQDRIEDVSHENRKDVQHDSSETSEESSESNEKPLQMKADEQKPEGTKLSENIEKPIKAENQPDEQKLNDEVEKSQSEVKLEINENNLNKDENMKLNEKSIAEEKPIQSKSITDHSLEQATSQSASVSEESIALSIKEEIKSISEQDPSSLLLIKSASVPQENSMNEEKANVVEDAIVLKNHKVESVKKQNADSINDNLKALPIENEPSNLEDAISKTVKEGIEKVILPTNEQEQFLKEEPKEEKVMDAVVKDTSNAKGEILSEINLSS
ncbi:hypothetical protein FQA39_LY17977 [Lamprigera yunnana]|nr:hypothetical protein FQA39_LY17977 [Lamprigera yunnana]